MDTPNLTAKGLLIDTPRKDLEAFKFNLMQIYEDL